MRLIVCPQSRLAEARSLAPGAPVLSLLSPGTPETALAPGDLRLSFHDIAEPRDGLIAPDAAIVDGILRFGRQAGEVAIVHCYAGVSRSTAAAYAMAIDRSQGNDIDLARALRDHSPEATPNPLVVALADGALGRNGRMVSAIAGIARGCETHEGRLFVWTV